MNRDQILDKAAQAMHAAYAPGITKDPRWLARSVAAYRRRFETGLNAVEDDIRRDERNRITNWLRECAARPDFDIAPQGRFTLEAMANELDRRPIGDVELS